MNSLNNRELAVLRLVAISYIPSIGNLGPTIENTEGKNGPKPNKGLAKIVSLRKVEGGIVIQAIANTGTAKGKEFEAFIPDSRIEIMQFKDVDTGEKSNKEG